VNGAAVRFAGYRLGVNSDDLTLSASAATFAESRHRDPFRTVAHCDTLELAN